MAKEVSTSIRCDEMGAPDHTKVGIKLIFLVVILVLGYKHTKKPAVSTKIWASMVGLTLINLVIALTL